ncbi:MAG: autotransporter-associated beta strand repeat-containing protein [Planctomycetia bacterium]
MRRSLLQSATVFVRRAVIGIACGFVCMAVTHAQSITWSGSTSPLWNVTGNWFGGVQPGASNIIVFGTASTVNLSGTLGANFSVAGLTVGSTPGNVSISGNTLTLGTNGIDMSSAANSTNSLTIGSTLNFNATSNVNVASGRSLTWNASGANFNSGTVTFSGAGTVAANIATNIANTSGSNATVVLQSGTFSIGNGPNLMIGNASNTLGSFINNGGTITHQFGAFQIGFSGSGAFLQTAGLTQVSVLRFKTGDLRISGGTFSANTFDEMANSASNVASITLTGGTTTLPAFPTTRGTGATATVTFDGGVLRPRATSSAYLQGLTNAYLTNNGAFLDTNGNDITIAQVLQDGTAAGTAGRLTKSGAGTLTLTGSNSYSGGTVINAGAIQVKGESLPNAGLGTGALNIANDAAGLIVWWNTANSTGTIANNVTINSSVSPTATKEAIFLDGGNGGNLLLSGSVTLSNAASSLGSYQSQMITITGKVTGTGGLNKGMGAANNTGSLVLSNTANDYSGNTTVVSGVLRLGASNAVPFGAGKGNLVLNGGANSFQAGTFDLNGFNQTVNGLSGTANTNLGRVVNNASGTSTLTIGANNTTSSFAGQLADGGVGKVLALSKTGSGTLTISGSNTYTGTTTLSGGALSLGGSSALAGGGSITFNGGTLQLTASNVLDYSVRIVGSGSAISLDTNSQNVTLASALASSNVGGLSVLGSGTVTLQGANAYGGATALQNGVMMLDSGNDRLPTATTLTLGAAGSSAKLVLGALGVARNQTLAGLLATGSGGSVVGHAAANSTLTLNIAASNTFAGQLGGGSTNENNLALVKSGAGTLNLTGTNSFSGGTTVNAGMLGLSNLAVTNIGLGGGNLNIATDGAGLRVWYSAVGSGTIANNITLNSSVSTDPAKEAIFVDGGGANSLTLSGTVTLSNAASSIGSYWTNSVAITGKVTGVGGLSKGMGAANNTGMLTLSNAGNDYSGNTAVVSGTLRLGVTNAVPFGTGKGNLVLNGGTASFRAGSFDLNGFDQTINGLSGTSNTFLGQVVNNATGTSTLTAGANDTTSSFAGQLSDGGVGRVLAVTKTGAGTLTLSGSSNFTGATTIAGGVLSVASGGMLAGSTGAIVINGGELKYNSSSTLSRSITFTAGTISGTGSIGTAVTVNTGDVLSPGNSPGVQNYTNGLTFGSGGQYIWEINNWAGSPGTGYDQLAVAGSALNITATSGSTFTVAVTGLTAGNASGAVPGFSATSGTGTSFTIATSSAGITGFDKTKFAVDTSGFTNNNALPASAGFWVSQSGSNMLLNYAPSATRSLSAATSAAQIIVGGTATISASVINAGVPASNPDALSYTGLSVGNGVTLGSTSGAGVTAGGTSTTSGAFSTVTAGTYTFTPSVATATNTNIGTNALVGSTGAATVTVLDHATSSLSGTGAVLSAVLNLGTWDYGVGAWTVGTNTGTFSVFNLASLAGASLTADLSLNGYTANGGGFSTNLNAYSDILGGQSSPFTITVDPSSFLTSGTQSKTFTLTMADKTGLSGGAATNTLTVTANVVVVPEPSAAMLAGLAVFTACWVAWRRRCPDA